MQKQILYPDGTTKAISEQVDTDPANMIAVAKENSSDPGAPYVIMGTSLDAVEATERRTVIVAAFGVVIFENVFA